MNITFDQIDSLLLSLEKTINFQGVFPSPKALQRIRDSIKNELANDGIDISDQIVFGDLKGDQLLVWMELARYIQLVENRKIFSSEQTAMEAEQLFIKHNGVIPLFESSAPLLVHLPCGEISETCSDNFYLTSEKKLISLGGALYLMRPCNDHAVTVRIRAGDVDVIIKNLESGVEVELYSAHNPEADVLGSTYAHFADVLSTR